MRAFIRARATFANVTALFALVVALSGSAFAVATVTSSDIKDNDVKSIDVRDDSARGGGLVGKDIKESTLAQLNISQVINTGGPLPQTGSFRSQGGKLLIITSGSAWRNSGASEGVLGIDVLLDGNVIASPRGYTNELSSHKALVTDMVVVDAPAGAHEIELIAKYNADDCDRYYDGPETFCTRTDAEDTFSVSVIELP